LSLAFAIVLLSGLPKKALFISIFRKTSKVKIFFQKESEWLFSLACFLSANSCLYFYNMKLVNDGTEKGVACFDAEQAK